MNMRGGGLSRSSVESFLPHSAEIFRRREPSSVSLISGIEKFYASEGYVTILGFLSKFFCPTVPKYFVGEPFCAVFQKISGSEKVYGKQGGGSMKIFRRKFFVPRCRNIP